MVFTLPGCVRCRVVHIQTKRFIRTLLIFQKLQRIICKQIAYIFRGLIRFSIPNHRRFIIRTRAKCMNIPKFKTLLRFLRISQMPFATQPTVWRDNLSPQAESLLWFGWMGDGRCLSVDKMRVGMRQFNEAMISTANEISVPYVDLSSLDGNEALFIDDCHFSEAGGREVARSIAEWFIQNRSGNHWHGDP